MGHPPCPSIRIPKHLAQAIPSYARVEQPPSAVRISSGLLRVLFGYTGFGFRFQLPDCQITQSSNPTGGTPRHRSHSSQFGVHFSIFPINGSSDYQITRFSPCLRVSLVNVALPINGSSDYQITRCHPPAFHPIRSHSSQFGVGFSDARVEQPPSGVRISLCSFVFLCGKPVFLICNHPRQSAVCFPVTGNRCDQCSSAVCFFLTPASSCLMSG